MRAIPELSTTELHVALVCRFTMLAKSIGVCVSSKCAQSSREVMVRGAEPGVVFSAGLGGPTRWGVGAGFRYLRA